MKMMKMNLVFKHYQNIILLNDIIKLFYVE